MNKDGFLENRFCAGCGNALQSQGSGRPAESYAGTYNGLCYPCTNAGPFVLTDFYYLSGAIRWNHPPHCPSWRRDRETFLAYYDCENSACGGKGRIMVYRPDGQGGNYPLQCATCWARHSTHPSTVAATAYDNLVTAAVTKWRKAVDADYKKRLGKSNDKAFAKQLAKEILANAAPMPRAV